MATKKHLAKEQQYQIKFEEKARIERFWHSRGYSEICGIDEVGRGCLAGPVVACALLLPSDVVILGLDDSKKLSETKRNQLKATIDALGIQYGIGVVSADEIDQGDILQATKQAMLQAYTKLVEKSAPDLALIDGNQPIKLPCPSDCVIGGDQKTNVIAAASIVAKVYRDQLMAEFAKEYPEYDFAKNKGYGTLTHRVALQEYGASPIHRQSFLSKIAVNPKQRYKSQVGVQGEKYVADALEKQGYRILARRETYHSIGELDLVCTKNDCIYAIEVKSRSDRSDSFGGLAEAMTPAKIRRTKRSFGLYLAQNNLSEKKSLILLAQVKIATDGTPVWVDFVPIN